MTTSRLSLLMRAARTIARAVRTYSVRTPAIYLSPDEAEAMELLTDAHASQGFLTAASAGVEQATLDSLLAKGAAKSRDGVRFALTSDDLAE